MTSLHVDDLELISRAAEGAGRIACDYFRQDPRVWWKEGNSPVSEADFAVDRFLKETLLGARPDYGWLSEEMGTAEAGTQGDCDRFFVVDPIDGTRAYLRGERTWCVSIAVIEHGRPIVGAIHAPALDERFHVTVDGPALFNDGPCEVSAAGEGGPIELAVPEAMRKRLARTFGRKEQETVQMVSAVPTLAYRLALVASGRLDGTLIRSRANDWDIAAADLLLERAGGLLCGREGRPTVYTRAGRRHGLLFAAPRAAIARLARLTEAIAD